MPTQAAAAWLPSPPDDLGVGTMKVAVTDLYVPWRKHVSKRKRCGPFGAHLGSVQDGTSPVRAELGVSLVGDLGVRRANTASTAGSARLETLPGGGEGEGSGGEDGLNEEGGDEHGGAEGVESKELWGCRVERG